MSLVDHARALAAEQGHEVRATIEALLTQLQRADAAYIELARALSEARAGQDEAYNEVAGLHYELQLMRDAWRDGTADDARLRAAEARVWPGETRGCDAPDALADEVLWLRAELQEMERQRDGAREEAERRHDALVRRQRDEETEREAIAADRWHTAACEIRDVARRAIGAWREAGASEALARQQYHRERRHRLALEARVAELERDVDRARLDAAAWQMEALREPVREIRTLWQGREGERE